MIPQSTGKMLFTSEAVSKGHPDKVADQISDAILDDFLKHDPTARVAVETLVTTNHVTVAGEVRSTYTPNFEALIRQTIADIGYTADIQPDFNNEAVQISNHIHTQSAEIAQGVDVNEKTEEGAGDQGIMFGYASDETPDYMPAPLYYAHRLLAELQRMKRTDPRLRPDAKSQLTFEYENGVPKRVHTLLVSHQHAPELKKPELTDLVYEAATKVLGSMLDADTRVLVNPTGSFIQGGPSADTGLTGRKIIVDTYGGMAHHGGGAFSGKDPTKVDRSAAYAARYLAKNIVAAKLAKACEIQLCYAIGVPEPLAVYVNTYGTAKLPDFDRKIAAILPQICPLTPAGMRQHFGLQNPIYLSAAGRCHFGHKPDKDGTGTFSWERLDLVEKLQTVADSWT